MIIWDSEDSPHPIQKDNSSKMIIANSGVFIVANYERGSPITTLLFFGPQAGQLAIAWDTWIDTLGPDEITDINTNTEEAIAICFSL